MDPEPAAIGTDKPPRGLLRSMVLTAAWAIAAGLAAGLIADELFGALLFALLAAVWGGVMSGWVAGHVAPGAQRPAILGAVVWGARVNASLIPISAPFSDRFPGLMFLWLILPFGPALGAGGLGPLSVFLFGSSAGIWGARLGAALGFLAFGILCAVVLLE